MKQALFRGREMRAPLIALVAAIVGLMALGSQQAHAADLTGNATLTSDYVWRGSTQSSGDFAAQAGVKLAGASGLYASAWGSNVKFAAGNTASSELDLTLGWSRPINDDWAIDLNLLHYRYPASNAAHWTELNTSLTYKNTYWLALGHSRKALGVDAAGTYVQVGGKLPINAQLRLEANAGHYFLKDAAFAADGYSHAQLSAVWAFKTPFELRLSAHSASDNADALFGQPYAGQRFEAALQASF